MPLRSISVENYRCFADRQTLGLRPLTILLGRNNAGKSALARLPFIAATGFRTSSAAPLDLESLNWENGTVFTELIRGHRPHGSVSLSFEFESDRGDVSLDVTVQNISETRSQLVSSFELRASGVHLGFKWDQKAPQPEARTYVSTHGQTFEGPIDFAGLLPVVAPQKLAGDATDEVTRLIATIRNDFDDLRYVGPFRDKPKRFYQLPSRTPDAVGVVGEHAPALLAADRILGDSSLLGLVNQHLADAAAPTWAIDIDSSTGLENLYSIVLAAQAEPEVRINLADTGTGIAQALPILVQRARDTQTPPSRPTLEIVEQPELHLHPAAHASLADLYLAGVETSRCRYVIETHSETFILRVRRRIAEGLDPANVGLYFVEHDGTSAHLTEIGLDELGNVDHWPPGVFSEDYEETRALVDAQINAAPDADQD
ncbi:DUF3696 domain-containing protein [Baekduia sp. Peel2402]|uniref:DUF3696 domain-containing protein n=1 Tax=Baekduia sp. Peel2402 TaxID=3458296 RepID=UPI00403E5A16